MWCAWYSSLIVCAIEYVRIDAPGYVRIKVVYKVLEVSQESHIHRFQNAGLLFDDREHGIQFAGIFFANHDSVEVSVLGCLFTGDYIVQFLHHRISFGVFI